MSDHEDNVGLSRVDLRNNNGQQAVVSNETVNINLADAADRTWPCNAKFESC